VEGYWRHRARRLHSCAYRLPLLSIDGRAFVIRFTLFLHILPRAKRYHLRATGLPLRPRALTSLPFIALPSTDPVTTPAQHPHTLSHAITAAYHRTLCYRRRTRACAGVPFERHFPVCCASPHLNITVEAFTGTGVIMIASNSTNSHTGGNGRRMAVRLSHNTLCTVPLFIDSIPTTMFSLRSRNSREGTLDGDYPPGHARRHRHGIDG